MDSQGEEQPNDAAFSEPVPVTMSRGCEIEQEPPAALGESPCEATTAEPQIRDTEANHDVAINNPRASTPSSTPMANLEVMSSLAMKPSSAASPGHPQHQHMHTHLNYDLTGASVNIIRDSHISETQLSLVASPATCNSKSVPGPIGSSKPLNPPHGLSLLFAKCCLCIAKCLDSEGKLDDLKLVLQLWSCHDTTETLIPEAHAAKTVVQLFQQATARHLWHWLDFEYLIQLLDTVSSENAKEILQDYDKHLLQFCEKELSALIPYKESPAPTEEAWMDVKWKGDMAKFKLGNLYECKEFLTNHLGIQSSAFVFYELFRGCVTFRWVVLTSSACAAIEAKLCNAGCIQFLDAEMEIKLIRPVKPSKQRMTHASNKENIYELDECDFGKTKYSFFEHVPDYAKCPICLSVLQNTVVSKCCGKPFCLQCYEKTKKTTIGCPLCRCEDLDAEENIFFDKQVVGTLYAKCSCCGWMGYLSDAVSEVSHPCALDAQTSGEVIQEASEHPEPDDDDESQVQDSLLSVEEPVAAEAQLPSEFNEKVPLLGMMHELRSNIQIMQSYIDDDRLSNRSGNLSISAAAEAFRSGMDDMTALMQSYEDSLLAENSVASCPDGQPAPVSELANPEQENLARSGLVPATGLSEPNPQPGMPAQAAPQIPAPGLQMLPTAHTVPKPTTDTPLMGPLHLACWHGQYDKFRKLVDQSTADINAVGMFRMTPLHMAMFRGHAGIASDLLSMGAGIDPHSCIGLSTLHHFGANNSQAMSMLLHARANLPQEVSRLVHLAATAGDASLVEKLIQTTKLHPDHNTYTGQSLLFVACQQGYVKMTEKLLALGATANFPAAFGRSPMHGACHSGSLPCLSLLLKKHANVNVCDASGDTPLHTATRQGHAMVVQELVKHGCEVNAADSLGRSPLHFAAHKDNCKLVAILHKAGANLDVVDHNGVTPVHVAVTVGNTAAVKELLDVGANPNLPAKDLLTPLHSAARQKDQGKAMIRLLHRAKANINLRDGKGRGLLYHAVRSGSMEIVQCVISLGCSVDEAASGEASEQVRRSAQHESLHPAAEFPIPDEDDLIMGVSGMHTGDIGPLHLAILLGYAEIVDFLIFKGADIHKVTSTGFTAMHFAVRNGDPHFVWRLVAKGCNPNQRSHDGFAPLHLAAQWGLKDAAEMLIRAGCDKELPTGNKHKPRQLTALLMATMMHQTKLLVTLIKEGCKVLATTADDSNAIHLAVVGLQLPILPGGQNPFLDPNRGSGFCETVKILVEHGCNVNAMNSEGLTPLDLLQNIHKKMQALPPVLRYGLNYEEVENGYIFMRESKALTSQELHHREKVATALSHVTTGAENIEIRLKTAPRHKLKYTGEQDILTCPPLSNDLTHLVVPQAAHLWREIGEHLSVNSTLLELAHTQCKGNMKECCKRVFGFWLNGAGKRPITWSTALDALRAVGLGPLADSVLQQLQNWY